MSATNLGKVNKIIDPTNPNNYWEIEDKYAREQVVLKLQKTMVNSLPAKPTTYEDWIAMQPFLYYLPITGQDNEYEVWTLFFMGDPTVASDYTDTSNYEWAKCGKTDVDLSNFSTKGHTHEVVTDVAVEDHDYTPQGQVVSQFEGASGETTGDNTHKHTYTPQGSVNSSFSGTQGETQNGTTGITPSKTKKALKKKTIKLESAGVTITPSTANRATGDLESLGAYDSSKAVFNGISVSDGALSFGIKKMSTAQTMTGASGSTDATKVTLGGNTTTEESLATGDLEDNAQAANQVMTDVALNDPGHKHNFTPAGSVSSSFSGTQGETSEVTHSHNFQAHGSVMSGFRGLRANLKHRVDNRRIITSPDQEDPGSHIFDWYGIRYDENASSRFKERIGNMDMHRMLPIQTKMRRCILGDDGEVNYYLDDRDSTKRAGSQEGWVETQETFISKIETSELRDETETIEKIEGKSFAWNQLVPSENINFANSETDSRNFFEIQGAIYNSSSQYLATMFSENITSPTIKRYLFTAPSNSSYFRVKHNGQSLDIYIDNRIPVISGHKYMFGLNAKSVNPSTVNGLVLNDVQLYDFTRIFGAGNEPITVEAFESWLLANKGSLGPFPYNAGELLNVKMEGMKTVGFNKWDEEWEVGSIDAYGDNVSNSTSIRGKNYIQVFPNTTYYAKGTLAVFYYDANKSFLSYEMKTDTSFTTPSNCVYFRLAPSVLITYGSIYKHDICINISDPSRNGEYVPYQEHNYPQQITKWTGINSVTGVREVMFPNGMKWADNAGTVKDILYRENGVTKAVKKVGDADLGTLNWTLNNNYWQTTDFKMSIVTSTANKTPVISANYISVPTNTTLPAQSIGINQYATSVNNESTTVEPTGMLNYELATPITYTDIQDENGSPVILPIEMEVEHNGTISLLPEVTTTQVTAAPTLTMKKYVLTQGANLDGSDGQVMVEIPEHWRRVERVTEGSSTYIYAKISPYPQVGWHHVSKNYVAAFEATIIDEKLASTSALVPVDASTPIWGRNSSGKITVNCDLTNSRKPTTVKSGATLNVDGFRAFARARNGATTAEWNGQTWQQWVDVSWLYFIEYATTNSQGPVKLERDANGYMQGGLGDGFSGFSEWASYNNYYPVVPCGITAVLGNNSGEVMLYVNNRYLPVNSYRGIENPFGHLWKLCDGIKYNGTTIYRALNPADYSNAESTTGYVEVGTKGDTEGYVTKVLAQVASGYDERFDGDLTPTAVGGGTTSYYCDYYWRNTGWRACLLGGAANAGASDGFVGVYSGDELGIANRGCGSRLCFLPSSEMS